MCSLLLCYVCVRVGGVAKRDMVEERRFLFGAVNATLVDPSVEEKKSLLGRDEKEVKKVEEKKERNAGSGKG